MSTSTPDPVAQLSELLQVDNQAGVLRVTFNRPEKKNAINSEMWAALRETFRAASQDNSVCCVLLSGQGDHFSAGVDLGSFSAEPTEDEHPFESAARAVAEFDKPIVAAVQGVSVGGGATVLFHCDIVYAAESLRLRLPFANLALPPEWASSYMLQANIGAQRAAELFYTAEWVDAERALQLGLVAGVLPDGELLDHALAKAREIARWPATTLQEIKRLLRAPHLENIDRAITAEQEAMYRMAGSTDNIEAVTAIIEKRPPNFHKD